MRKIFTHLQVGGSYCTVVLLQTNISKAKLVGLVENKVICQGLCCSHWAIKRKQTKKSHTLPTELPECSCSCWYSLSIQTRLNIKYHCVCKEEGGPLAIVWAKLIIMYRDQGTHGAWISAVANISIIWYLTPKKKNKDSKSSIGRMAFIRQHKEWLCCGNTNRPHYYKKLSVWGSNPPLQD